MCTRITCPNCKLTTVKGCGIQSHVEWVLWDVDLDKRCKCGPIVEINDEEQVNNSDNDDCPSSVLVLTRGK
jgi:hypothetical protein